MKVITQKLGDFKEIEILPLADLHLGDPHSDFKRIQEWIAYIRDHDNVFTVLDGDLMDSATTASIGDTYGASLQPMEQLRSCVDLFGPIKEKILAVLPGNHEHRIYKTDGIDITEIMCAQLGIAERYSNASTLLFVRFGLDTRNGHGRPITYSIYIVHGSGSGRTEGAKINRLTQLASIIDADIYIHGHSHTPAIVKNGFFRVDTSNHAVKKVDRLFVNTSAALEYGGYGEVQSFKPTSLETPLIHLNGRRKRMAATL